MKSLSLLLMTLFSIISTSAIGQEKTQVLNINLEGIHVLMLDSEGTAIISPIDSKHLNIKSSLFSEGDVWGLKFPKNRQAFEINTKRQADTLFITTPAYFSYRSIGINTYAERIENKIQISKDIKLIINKSKKVDLHGGFPYVKIKYADQVEFTSSNQSNIKTINCQGSLAILVNGQAKRLTYEYEGFGVESYFFNAKNISLNY